MGDERHFAGPTTRLLVRLVRSRGGEAAVERVLARAGECRTATELEDVLTWSSYHQFRALLEATITVLEDPTAARGVGEQVLLHYRSAADFSGLLRSLGTPAEVLRRMPLVAARLCTIVDMHALDVGDGFGLVSATSRPGFPRYRALCDYTVGLLARVPSVFELPPADVVEVQCEAAGDPQCLFRLSWAPDGPVPVAEAVDRAYRAVSGRFEVLRDSVADLVSTDDVETVLARIAGRAGLAVRAPRHLLAVRSRPEGAISVHNQGFSDEEAAEAAAHLLSADPHDEDGAWLIVDVVSSRRNYGRLAAVHRAGATFFPQERAVLSAYGRLAAAALDAAIAVEEARRQAIVARALLDLARELATPASVRGVAEGIAAAVPKVIDADAAAVWLWDAAAGSLALAAHVGFSPDAERAATDMEVGLGDRQALQQMLDDPRPRFASAGCTDGVMARLLELTGHSAAAVVPIVIDGAVLGALAAGVVAGPERLQATSDTVDRLNGLAQFAGVAVRSALLIDEMRHHADHDPLTGLPNQRLLADRLDRAIAYAERTGDPFAVLYVDLDRFKEVNDTFGHSLGDELLRQVAQRLSHTVRAEDTVARLGGDEFVILLPRVRARDEVALVAEKVRGVLRERFEICGHSVDVTGSIGVAVFPGSGTGSHALLRTADAAMYEAKKAGRDRVAGLS